MDRPRVASIAAERDDGADHDDLDMLDPDQRDIAVFSHAANMSPSLFADLVGSIAPLVGMQDNEALKQRVRERGTAELHRIMSDIVLRQLGSDADREILRDIYMRCEELYRSRNTMSGIRSAYVRFMSECVYVTRQIMLSFPPSVGDYREIIYHSRRYNERRGQYIEHGYTLANWNAILPTLCIGAIDECALMFQLGVPHEHLAVNGVVLDDIAGQLTLDPHAKEFYRLTSWMVALSRDRPYEDLHLPEIVDVALDAANAFIKNIMDVTEGPLAINRSFVLMFMLASMREFIRSLAVSDGEKGAILKSVDDINKLLLAANNDVMPTSFVALELAP